MGKSTISMAIFNSYVKLPEGNPTVWPAAHEMAIAIGLAKNILLMSPHTATVVS